MTSTDWGPEVVAGPKTPPEPRGDKLRRLPLTTRMRRYWQLYVLLICP